MDPEDILTDGPQAPELPEVPGVPELPDLSDVPFLLALPWVFHLLWILVLAAAVLLAFRSVRRQQRADAEAVAPLLERARRARAERESSAQS